MKKIFILLFIVLLASCTVKVSTVEEANSTFDFTAADANNLLDESKSRKLEEILDEIKRRTNRGLSSTLVDVTDDYYISQLKERGFTVEKSTTYLDVSW